MNVHFSAKMDEEPHRGQDKLDFAGNFARDGFDYFDVEIHLLRSPLNAMSVVASLTMLCCFGLSSCASQTLH